MKHLEESNQISETDIAIIGMAGRFPKASNLDIHWQNLRDGVEAISYFNDQNLLTKGVDSKLLNNPQYVKAGFVLEDVELFAASFFDYSPREAEIMDPQHRIFLESVWQALENAGYNSQTYPGQITLYASSSINTYFIFNLLPNSALVKLVGLDQIRHNNRVDNLATRVAYKLNLKGSAITVQTGCSSSLVATHLACQSLLNYECEIALAGGVSIAAYQENGYLYQEGGILSPDGHCRAFDVQAKGTVNGNGVGVVVLKLLQNAINDGDFIHAIIKGTAVNNDGSTKVGYTAPSVDGQAKVIAEALAVAEVDPETINYIETHGTGTVLGDPIEIAALNKCFRAYTQKTNFCAIGSIKTNIGHLDAAAGIAGLIKTTLALENKQLPPSLHFTAPNPQIDFAHSPFYVNNKLREWHSQASPRRAGVSSFGIGGTNAHIILEESPPLLPSGTSRTWQILPISAKTNSALAAATTNLANHLQKNPDLNLADVAYTLSVGRQSFEHRRLVLSQNISEAIQILENSHQSSSQIASSSIVFMFPGQGSQYVNMARELYQTEKIFREQVDICCELLKPFLNLDLREIIYPDTTQIPTATQQLTETAITQPALFVIEYALAKLWMRWGIIPQVMIGHSIGEYVAACLAGVFSLQDVLALVAMRGKLMQQLPSGKMLAVFLPEAEVVNFLNENLSLAANNAPNLCVVSGNHTDVEELDQKLTSRGIETRYLHTSHAFHSQMMNPIIEEFQECVSRIKLQSPQIPFISNVTGTWITITQATDPHYWGKHLQNTVRFAEGICELMKQPGRIFLEVGAGKTLGKLLGQYPQIQNSHTILASLRHPQAQESDVKFLLHTLGELWLAGVDINWKEFYHLQRRYRLPLPTYPFERQRFWIEPQNNIATVPQISEDINDWFYIPVWKQSRLLKSVNDQQQKLSWLVFVDDCGIGRKIIDKLQQQDQDMIIVQMGDNFQKIQDNFYVINPQIKEDYIALIEDLKCLGKTPQMITHFWGVTTNQPPLSTIDNWEVNQAVGFWSLLFLVQAIAQYSIQDKLQIMVVTNNLHNVTGEENLSPEKTTVLGACKVIGQEFSYITCRNIDIVIPEGESKQQKLIETLLAEFQSSSQDLLVAYRGQHRWIQTFEQTELEPVSADKSLLRRGGVYLITGGLGGIGLAIAEYLAANFQAKLILIGRSDFPDADQWEEWLKNHDAQEAVSQKIKKLQFLENLGAEVLVCTADVTQLEQMQVVKVEAVKKFGEINGIIHAAGVAGGGIIQLKTAEAASKVVAPKVKGTLVLEQIFCEQKLDFLVLFSSLTAILGGLGQVDYCAANAFLDGFAQSRSFQEKPAVICINWCGWQEVGMLVNTVIPEELKTRREQHLIQGLSLQEGVNVFSRILNSGLTQTVVTKQNLNHQIIENYAKLDMVEELTKLEATLSEKPKIKTLHVRPNLTTEYVAPSNEIEQAIANIWQQLLGLEKVGINDNFFDLGGHSLLATQIVSQLRKAFLVEVPLSSLFSESSTIAKLAETIEQLILDKIENLSEAEVNQLLNI